MTHALPSTIPAPAPVAKASSPGGPNRALRRWLAAELARLEPLVAASAAACAAERYRKHFYSFAHVCVLLFHGLAGRRSLRQSYAAFAACPGLVQLSGLQSTRPDALGVSLSALADANTQRPVGFLAGLVPSLIARVRHLDHASQGQSRLPPNLHLLDATFLRVSLRLAPWLQLSPRSKRPGVCVQLQYAPAFDLPEHIVLTDAHTPDVTGLDQIVLDDPVRLAALRDHTLVVDLGYYSHARLARLIAAGVHVVTRLHPQAAVRSEQELPVQQPLPGLGSGRITVLRDQRVRVGSTHNRAGAVLRGLRLVSACVQPTPAAARQGAAPQTYRVLTDRYDLSAAEVVQIYLWRWRIELFFRWLKSHLRLPRLLGYSQEAITLTVWLALVVHLLTVLAAHALGQRRRSPALLSQMPFVLAQLTAADALRPAHPLQLSLSCSALPP